MVKWSEFLWLDESKWITNRKKDIPEIDYDDTEVKAKLSVLFTSAVDQSITSTVQSRISSWNKLLRVTAWVIRWIKTVRKRVNKTNIDEKIPTELLVLSVEELIAAKVVVINGYHRIHFKVEFMLLDGCRNKKLKESIGCLNPYVDEDGLIRVGGRMQQSNLDGKIMHPVMLTKKGKLTEMIIRWCQQMTVKKRHTK